MAAVPNSPAGQGRVSVATRLCPVPTEGRRVAQRAWWPRGRMKRRTEPPGTVTRPQRAAPRQQRAARSSPARRRSARQPARLHLIVPPRPCRCSPHHRRSRVAARTLLCRPAPDAPLFAGDFLTPRGTAPRNRVQSFSMPSPRPSSYTSSGCVWVGPVILYHFVCSDWPTWLVWRGIVLRHASLSVNTVGHSLPRCGCVCPHPVVATGGSIPGSTLRDDATLTRDRAG
jgi:hypothetical protein